MITFMQNVGGAAISIVPNPLQKGGSFKLGRINRPFYHNNRPH
jgi:hypothetical protein